MTTQSASQMLVEFSPPQDEELILSTHEEVVQGKPQEPQGKKSFIARIEEIENAQKNKIQITYEKTINDVVQRQMQDFLSTFTKKLNDPALAEMKQAIYNKLDSENKKVFDEFVNKKDNQYFKDYKSFTDFYSAIQKSIKDNSADPTQAKNHVLFNAADRALSSISILSNINAGKVVQNLSDIGSIQETHHITKAKKKSFFRKVLEAIVPKLRTEDQETIVRKVNKVGSLQKAALDFATSNVVSSFKANGENYLNQFDLAVVNKKKEDKGKRFAITETESQAKTRLEKEKDEKPKPSSTAKTVGSVFYHATAAVGKGVIQQLGSKMYGSAIGSFIEGNLKVNEQITHKSMAEHLEDEFLLAAQKEVFNNMLKYANDLYGFYVMTERTKQNFPDMQLQAKEFGFKRFDDPEFKEFLTKLSHSLGFEIANTSQIESLYYADEATKAKAFERFVKGDKKNGVGIEVTSDVIAKEHAKVLGQGESGSANYFYVLDLNKQMIEELQQKERIKNGVVFVAKELQLEEKVYNPESAGALTTITSQFKQKLTEQLANQVEVYLDGAHEKGYLARGKFENMQENWKEQISMWMNNPESRTKRRSILSSPSKGASPTEMREAFAKAGSNAAEALYQSKEVTDVVASMHQNMLKQWRLSAIPLLENATKLGGKDLVNAIKAQLTAEVTKLKADGANPALIADLDKQLTYLISVTTPNGLDMSMIKKADPEQLKLVVDAFKHGVDSLYAKRETMSLDEQENLYMLNAAFSQVVNGHRIPDYARKIYDEVYQTHFDEISRQDPSIITSFLANQFAQKVQSTLMSSLSAPVTQLNYYVKQKSQPQNQLSLPSQATGYGVHPLPKAQTEQAQQGWGAWMYEKAANTLGYAYSGVAPIASIGLEAVGRYAFQSVTGLDIPHDPKSINQAIIDSCSTLIREQAFDSMLNMAAKMYQLQLLNSPEQGQKMGLGDQKKVIHFLNDVAQSLGFKDIQELSSLAQKSTSNLDKIKSLEEQQAQLVAKEKQAIGWGLMAASPELPQIQSELTKVREELANAKKELALANSQIQSVKEEFAKIPITDEQKFNDKFVGLKNIIQTEYGKLSKDILAGKLHDSANYLVLVNAMNNVVSQIELVQREKLAVELLGPDLEKMMGYDPKAQGIVANLIQAARNQGKEYGVSAGKQAVMMQLQSSIAQANDFASQMLAATVQKTAKLEQKREDSPPQRGMLSQWETSKSQKSSQKASQEVQSQAVLTPSTSRRKM